MSTELRCCRAGISSIQRPQVMFNAATILEMIHQAAGYGFTVDGTSFRRALSRTWARARRASCTHTRPRCVRPALCRRSLPALKQRRDAYVARLNGIYQNNLKNSGVDLVRGDAKFVGEKTVQVGDKTYTGKNILIAVGGTPTMPEIPGIELGMNSDGFFDLEAVPKKVAVVGSGYIAVELAGTLAGPKRGSPTHLGASPQQLGGVPGPPDLASGRAQNHDAPLFTHQAS